MTFTEAEIRFLERQPRGHLSTIGRDGGPQVKPVGFTYSPDTGTIDISGFNMAASAKYRNVQHQPSVAFVVDEVTEENSMEGAHFLEVRGRAETVTGIRPPDGHLAPEIIRVHPTRVVSFNVDPNEPGFSTRDVADASGDGG